MGLTYLVFLSAYHWCGAHRDVRTVSDENSCLQMIERNYNWLLAPMLSTGPELTIAVGHPSVPVTPGDPSVSKGPLAGVVVVGATFMVSWHPCQQILQYPCSGRTQTCVIYEKPCRYHPAALNTILNNITWYSRRP